MPVNHDFAGRVTLLVPTCGRPDDLQRTLTHLHQTLGGRGLCVLVLDGSSADIADRNRTVSKSFGFEHQAFSPDLNFLARWQAGFLAVQTPLVCMLPDDDLLDAYGFTSAVQYLEKHPETVSAHGRYLYVVPALDETKTYGKYRLEPHTTYWAESISDKTPLERLAHSYFRYTDLHYAVHRTHAIQSIMADAVAHVDPDYFIFVEFLLAARLPLLGKIKKLDQPYMLRQRLQPSHEKLSFDRFLLTPEFAPQYSRLKSALVPEIAKCNLSQKDADALMDQLFGAYLNRFWIDQNRSKAYVNRLLSSTGHTPKTMPKKPFNILWSNFVDLGETLISRWQLLRHVAIYKHDAFHRKAHDTLAKEAAHQQWLDFLNDYASPPLPVETEAEFVSSEY